MSISFADSLREQKKSYLVWMCISLFFLLRVWWITMHGDTEKVILRNTVGSDVATGLEFCYLESCKLSCRAAYIMTHSVDIITVALQQIKIKSSPCYAKQDQHVKKIYELGNLMGILAYKSISSRN